MPPISLQAMLHGLYNTTVEFFALRNPISSGDQSFGSIDSNTREQLDATDHRSRDTNLSHMRRGFDSITNQLAHSQGEVARLEERCRGLEKALKGAREMLEAKEADLQRLRSLESTRSEGSKNVLTRTGSGSSSILEEQQARSQSNEIFMTRIDSWSGQQVIQAVLDLNSEIIQFATSAIELCTFDQNNFGSPEAMQDTSARLSPNFANLLSARERNMQDPTLVGLALQAGVATCIARAMTGFALGLPTRAETTLSQVYSHIFYAEPQPTSSRWRALTHRHVHTLYPGLAEYSAEELRETICRWTSDILVAACATHESTSRKWIRETFGEQVGRMVKAVVAFAQICKEGIMSTNFDIIMVEPNQTFDERVMVDAFGDYGSSRGAVLATTELGLRRMTRRAIGGREEDGTVEHQILVRPKVILDSVNTAFT
ncbi:hypothetical protein GGX14DRAFT_418860 [Mycena pura]|uniref:Uncharacterized protein n=1 Tax=Mycena pura TaxID=153505 RepID=A0AAD6YRL5_9AGAR|nr:hypothetical protein GGX14DRAFT_418860 [Mycena pura]